MHRFLILAHEDPPLCARLAAALAPAGDVLVHVDARSRLSDFDEVRRHATVLDTRVATYWGGWSIVEATRLLAERALEDPGARQFTLLSGRHYPLVPPSTLRTPQERDRIRLIPAPDAAAGKPEARFRTRYLSRFRPDSTASVVVNGVARRTTCLRYEDALAGRTLFAGSTWWSLTRDTLVGALATLADDRRLTRYFERIACPDECALHTAVGSVFAARGDDPTARPGEETTFVAWAHRRHPEPLDAGLVARAQREGWWFARKFSSENPELIDRVEQGWG